MAIAFEMMRSGMIGRKAPARSYDVPKTVLLEKLSKRVPEELTSLGRKTIRGGDEKKNLKKYSTRMREVIDLLIKKEFISQAQLVVDGRETPFKNNVPGKRLVVEYSSTTPGNVLPQADDFHFGA
ncbi:hypothetical protein DPMN_088820 [Dreissena polymorpha]|uniref:Uncharacterized protein n=1 Tax=Dreissena polymorpha TaxID=45954 RepID=A0A9D4KUT3_DREPO|nr:hypothetical protein DPMN_088820 [Dreissena polymorpha]